MATSPADPRTVPCKLECGGVMFKGAKSCMACRKHRDTPHPSYLCYKRHGCRCPECRALATEARRAERRLQGVEPVIGFWGDISRKGDRGPREDAFTLSEIREARSGQAHSSAEGNTSRGQAA